MPHLEVNKAQIYYQTHGKFQEGTIPILLIHGSTADGETDWGTIGPLLGQDHYVIVPDCRGHGRSSNPLFSYSFLEMADDLAVLIHIMGFEQVDVIGHSNGGNVALCLLLEYPEIIHSCILQAANAYVSPDLVEREPPIFDPDRVALMTPEWKDEMVGLHGPVHGLSYWRELLKMTVNEIIREPNYTPGQLSNVKKPVFVIQGENDTVNNVGRHAQFLTGFIPKALMWIPNSIGHNVHKEIPDEWYRWVVNFIDQSV